MSENRKVLLVSSYPYSLSSRGMDVLTNCFEEESWSVDHLTFPRMFITPSVSTPKNTQVNCILAKKTFFPYIDRIMFWIPAFAFNIIKRMNNHKAIGIDFSKYDYIVLESGKPLFLMDLIPEKTPIKRKNAVYVGLHQLDFLTVKALVEECPECSFHIIGPCLRKKQVRGLKNYRNFNYYDFLSKEEYMPMLKWASFAIFPFRRTESMKWFGLTSKFLHFMYFNLPIISYPTGVDGEFKNLPVYFADSIPLFVKSVKEIINFSLYPHSIHQKWIPTEFLLSEPRLSLGFIIFVFY
jgi:hypothetical protein